MKRLVETFKLNSMSCRNCISISINSWLDTPPIFAKSLLASLRSSLNLFANKTPHKNNLISSLMYVKLVYKEILVQLIQPVEVDDAKDKGLETESAVLDYSLEVIGHSNARYLL